jgi:hypothetical protein
VAIDGLPALEAQSYATTTFGSFQPLSLSEVCCAIVASKSTVFLLDPVPTYLLKEMTNILTEGEI